MARPIVAFCIPNMIIGGVESVFIKTLEKILTRGDFEIVVIMHHPLQEPFYLQWFARNNVAIRVLYPTGNVFEKLQKYTQFFPLSNIRKVIFSAYKKYRNIVNERRHVFEDCDILIDYKNFSFAKQFRHHRQPKIAWFHGSLDYFDKNNFAHMATYYDQIVCLTDNFLKEFKQKYPALGNKILRIYNPIDAVEIKHMAGRLPRYGGKYFVSVSRIDADKDIKTILDAFNEFWLNAARPKVDLVLVGDGNQAANLRKYAAKLDASEHIVFIGANPVPFGYMRGAIANILSSYNEGLGMVLIEAAATNTLNISSDCPNGPREILMDGRAGLLFTPGDAHQLAVHMQNVWVRKAPIQNMIRTATKSLNRFSAENISDEVINLINKTIKGQ